MFNLNDKDMRNNFYNKDGQLSRYGFCCGYVQSKEGVNLWVHMYMEHNAYHVRVGKVIEGQHQPYDVWETYEPNELTKARKFYNSVNVK